ncbi:type I secretion membrane fusion protein, HlyD family [Rhizobium sp. CF122]|uniref:HlyD family type I secretion periplasmic adaptor subunit n=1 Tax=Rhizobium sp. CF122 TaxID=1144312 RepID=UPI00027174DE|nr:HlyD family type I secretion periplasmic adaptor subunit [Rhizobium sp. CF122]EJL56616.1 type I secretion membrane fusion protein, HlyD family [Rhizobium sp. CF122]
MNVLVRPNKRKGRPPKRPRADNAFLPAALEILETPASPIRTAFMWFIATVVISALVWSYLGTFDIVATAQGKIQPTGRVKVIQSIETGKTISVPVTNGARVKAGDLLVQLDETELKSDEDGILTELEALQAEVTRRKSVVDTAQRWQGDGIWLTERPGIQRELVFPGTVAPDVRDREQAIYRADLSQLDTALANIAAQRTQSEATVARLEQTVRAQTTLVDTLTERVKIHNALIDQSVGTRASLIDAMETQQKELAVLTEESGQLTEAKASLSVASSDGDKTLATFIADNVSREGEAARRADTLEQQLIKARKRRQSMTIASPIDGTVQASAITTVGQVVSAGAELMRIVPGDGTLEVEAYLPNRDIGFVAVGQPVVVKVEAFPFTRYGIITGRVTGVARDAIPEPDAGQLEGDPAKALQSAVPIANAQRVQNLVFPVTVRLDVHDIEIEGLRQPLSSGMSVTVEIKTGKRRILEYLFSPLAEIASGAMKER